MDEEKTIFKDIGNSLLTKRSKKTEALQKLVHIRPDLKGKSVYFFPTLDRYFEGILMFDAKEKKAYVYSIKNDRKYETFFKWMIGLKNQKLFKEKKSSLATIFLEPNPTSPSIASILRESDYPLYWKSSMLMSLEDIFMLIQENILLEGKFAEITAQKINGGLELYFFKKGGKSLEKKILFTAKGILLEYEVYILNHVLQGTHLPFPVKAGKRTLNDIKDLIQYVFSLNICYGQSTTGLEDVTYVRGTQLVNNAQNSSKEHTPFAFLEKQGQPDEAYWHVDCMLIVKKKEEVEISDEMASVVHDVAKSITSKNTDISHFHPIFQELIRIQTGKSNGTRYHPMFLRWAISVYSKSGHAAYSAMKTIMRLPSISTLKSYINENEQCSGWQNKIVSQILANLTANNIWGYGRVGFFSHDSFKIQKGLLWDQRKNCYVGYLDFENEMQEYKEFAIQCQNEVEFSTEKNCSPNSFDQKYELATQIHQFVWHSITHNFSFPIAYYGINNITAHNLNTLIFDLAAKLECVGIYTIGSICDGAGENRQHIKSFDWYASKWSPDDIVEVNFNKSRNYFHAAKIIDSNLEKTKFTVHRLNSNNSEKVTIERSFIHPSMPSKLEWKVNDLCEFKSPKDKQWHLGKITHFDPITSIFTVEISGITEGILAKEGWQVFDYHISEFLRPVYDSQKLSVSHKAINPITGEDWFFISDPTHVFKKLRNNLSKSHIGEKNAREIIFNKKEISWKHIKGVYEHTNKHATAKATKLTKRHIWLTSWSKMRVDLAEHTLSKEVEDALRSIKELKDISEGTRVSKLYSRKYRQIMHSKINFKSSKDPRIDTLKEIRDWFIYGNKQKTESKEWISPQCQFDLILSINGFLGMLEYILKKYPNSMVQPRRISQDVLEGLFGVIHEIGGDSSTHTLKSYGHALNKCQVVALVSSEVKSINYGKADSTGTGITTLTRRDYRKKNQDNNKKNNYIHQKYNSRLEQLSPISHDVFESLLVDDLIMGKINIPLGSHDKNVEQENSRIFHLQNERYNLIEAIFYEDSIDELLQKWQNIVRKISVGT
ncbi:hypothetical protein RclHR1_10700002 [Rhizophagus clarus]|uniref:Uncharacterized protein n=1 Tax=Rhizophagus clarus TaxID=94130 RepID=A0A2Z6QH03_9GLOM|nr:hypothetical protein RclHR1_10700002 [Rhizophagus clarus]